MKKFLIGIVTMVAAVMLSSPAFGAYTWYVSGDSNDSSQGYFEFDAELLDVSSIENPLDTGVTGSGPGYDAVVAEWGSLVGDIIPLDPQPYDGVYFDPLDEQTGNVFFNPGVQIVVAQWGTNQYGFLFDGYVQEFAWYDLENAMSHADGYNAVPVPAAVWLLGSGVLGLVAIRRRRS